ncbi:MAG: hypothetical protein DYH15_12150 [Nitrosomonas sp. PRO4]|nr:hypothetical protein [Nitrosomonas sp. PRO4]
MVNNENAKQRQRVLEVLYNRREEKPKNGWLSEKDLNDAVGETEFALSVLVELGHVKRDGYKLLITGQGVVACEEAATD